MEIKCPKCGTPFVIDEADYAIIVNQVRTQEFNQELDRRTHELNKLHESQQVVKLQEAEQAMAKKLASKDSELLKKDTEIAGLRERINGFEATKELAVNQAVSQKDIEIANLKASIAKSEDAQKIAIMEEQKKSSLQLSKKDQEVVLLQGQLKDAKADADEKIHQLQESHRNEIKLKDEQIEQYKNFKAKLSTKGIGESLEMFCFNKFQEVRSMGMYPYAYFDKDNDVKDGTKGDFIFRDYDGETEYISIMFEMKNEADKTATKHHNADFFEKLDKDRRQKNCEYAVLVSMLETEDETSVYNTTGIVNVSHQYEKMFVIRPQYFLTIIGLLTQMAKSNAEARRQLETAKQTSIDVTKFEEKLLAFQDKFSKNVIGANTKFEKAIEEIDKTVEHLLKVKEGLLGTVSQLSKADSTLNDITIKKLTYGNPTMKAVFEEARIANSANAEE